MTQVFFVTGTDTGIGKTYVTCQLVQQLQAQGLRVAVLKPVASGAIFHDNQWGSEDKLAYESVLKCATDYQEGWVFEPPIAPHLAARQEGTVLTAAAIASWCRQHCLPCYDVVLIEGAGGWRVPLNDQETWRHVIDSLQVPVIWVVGIRLGCINHALLTEQVLQADQVTLAGWVANHCEAQCSVPDQIVASLRQLLHSPCLGEFYRHAKRS